MTEWFNLESVCTIIIRTKLVKKLSLFSCVGNHVTDCMVRFIIHNIMFISREVEGKTITYYYFFSSGKYILDRLFSNESYIAQVIRHI
jgi:DNA polymerase III sliding clamp (beta) subunit (PCNA family)